MDMATGLNKVDPGRGLWRLAFRAPIWLFRAHLDRLLGDRFLLLIHRGRKSGLPRRTVLEVVRRDKSTGTYVVAAAWGEKADWYRNIQQTPEVIVRSGGRRIAARAERLSQAEAEVALADYAHRHPIAFRELAHFMVGLPGEDATPAPKRVAASIPLVALRPR